MSILELCTFCLLSASLLFWYFFYTPDGVFLSAKLILPSNRQITLIMKETFFFHACHLHVMLLDNLSNNNLPFKRLYLGLNGFQNRFIC